MYAAGANNDFQVKNNESEQVDRQTKHVTESRRNYIEPMNERVYEAIVYTAIRVLASS